MVCVLMNMQTVLTVGNTLNSATFRGGARGFQLDALLKVSQIAAGPVIMQR